MVKETTADALGVTTAQKGAKERLDEANAATRAADGAYAQLQERLRADSFQNPDQIRQALNEAITKATLSLAKSKAFRDYCEQYRDDLRGFNLDTATVNISQTEATVANLQGARVAA